jgi:transcription initiation factor IIE alpha subunit
MNSVKKATAKKPAKLSASGAVLAIVKRSRKGIDTATLEKKTGFKGRKIRDTIFRLRKQGKIKSERKGLYVKS